MQIYPFLSVDPEDFEVSREHLGPLVATVLMENSYNASIILI